MNVVGKNTAALVQISTAIDEDWASGKYQIPTKSIKIQHLLWNPMGSQIFEGCDRIRFGNFFVQIVFGGKIVNHRYDDARHQHCVGYVFILVPLILGNPASEHRREHGSAKWNEQQYETDMQACHCGAARDQQQFFEPPGETEKHLKQKENHDEAEKDFPSDQLERHRAPFIYVRYVDWLGKRHIKRIDGQLRSVRSDGQHGEAEQQSGFKLQPLFTCPGDCFHAALLKGEQSCTQI